ncbi:unnamed protein product [Boreogadus saida]
MCVCMSVFVCVCCVRLSVHVSRCRMSGSLCCRAECVCVQHSVCRVCVQHSDGLPISAPSQPPVISDIRDSSRVQGRQTASTAELKDRVKHPAFAFPDATYRKLKQDVEAGH